jgi:threonine synthase
MSKFARNGKFGLRDMGRIHPDSLFVAGAADDLSTLVEIRRCYRENKYVLDPHSAVGMRVARRFLDKDEPMICLATAHPAKFGKAVRRAIGTSAVSHPLIEALKKKKIRRFILPADPEVVREFIIEQVIQTAG